MTIQQLAYIVALDDHRHFVKAAESCLVAQPTLTLQVKKLEEEVGLTLFDRTKHPLQPTPMGEKFIQKARSILREVNELKEIVNTDKDELEGSFVLGIIPTLAPYLLPRFVRRFCDEHPKIKLEIKEMQSVHIITSLKSNLIQMGIMATPVDDNAIKEIPLFNEPFLVYANPGHPLLEKEYVDQKDIVGDGLWLLNEGHCFRNQVMNICSMQTKAAAHPGLSFESGSIETIKNMVRSDMGYSLIPELSVNEQIDRDLVRRFKAPELTREISLVAHHSFTRSVLLDHLRKSIVAGIPSTFKRNTNVARVKWT
ncbi:hydrogen peroxide-inducible genes activator [Mangrovibacterium diazotrophicum]|uniref:LysR family hydrogen peroxide-inducible transcriptional activator n=1 Tax=Mangrovibacterium diazotrophicum TaxID=1261403 RepID=A0A419VWK9_9BACT|nr:hydrogen peroxide-inducible genes activator [Mangrovibacterium diazotrophicum]RKD86539.1 LysR family hydrogen peroxide-inducible transcriptional activator [Mangrovibacterium diazotrophicum]